MHTQSFAIFVRTCAWEWKWQNVRKIHSWQACWVSYLREICEKSADPWFFALTPTLFNNCDTRLHQIRANATVAEVLRCKINFSFQNFQEDWFRRKELLYTEKALLSITKARLLAFSNDRRARGVFQNPPSEQKHRKRTVCLDVNNGAIELSDARRMKQ